MTLHKPDEPIGTRKEFPASRRLPPPSRSTSKEHAPSPARPQLHPETRSKGKQERQNRDELTPGVQRFGADGTLGQFSFAPATETTVVTTTTTTTTRFPPFVMKDPRRIQELDPKLYPLATTPTPSALKNISFEVGGKRTMFREGDENIVAIEEMDQESAVSRPTRTVQTGKIVEDDQPISLGLFGPETQTPTTIERPASPDSISEQPESTNKTPALVGVAGSGLLSDDPTLAPSFKLFETVDSTLLDSESHAQRRSARRVEAFTDWRKASLLDRSPLTPSASQQNTPTVFTSTRDRRVSRDNASGAQATPVSSNSRQASLASPTSRLANSQLNAELVAPTPPIQGDERQFAVPPRRRSLASIPSRLAAVDTSIAQDGSLPSPSLSPITAAATLQNTGYFADVDSGSELASQQDHDMDENDRSFQDDAVIRDYGSFSPRRQLSTLGKSQGNVSTPSVHDIPSMIDFFEAVPDALKGYVMHQLLRRCPKRTLQLVADAVNPALKCDFVGMLPPELSLNILKFLDVKSLCRASQVSRKWRHLVNGDEQAWKTLFDADGLSLPQGELQRAIREGWGWQDPTGIDGFERDLATSSNSRSESDASLSRQGQQSTPSSSSRRPKRKATSKFSSRTKQQKRKETIADVSEPADLSSQISSIEGPYNAANAAAVAVPYPKVGLPSLRDLHLYKSLYRRHDLIRKNWMRREAKPRHLAFRAHDRHVVTCLGFDDDKIVTGSDDTNINVYDTKTGALRAKLEGHEGGVWALQYEGNVLVSGSTDRSVRVWDIAKGEQTQVFHGHTSTVRCLQILMPTKVGETVDGKSIMMPKQPLIITGSRDSNLRVWKLPQPGDPLYNPTVPPVDDTDCPYFIRLLTGHQHSVRAIAAHADTLVSGSYDHTVRVWKISTGELVHRLQGHAQKVYSVVLDQSRNRCISGSMDNLVKIWSLDTGSLLYTLDGHSLLVGLLDLNSERLVSAAADSTLRIWDPENGQCKATLSAHTGAITCFQHDGQKVISGSDRTLKMWDVKTGECVKDLLTDLTGVWQVKFNERRCVAAVQRDNMTYIEVLDFGAARDGVPESGRGSRILVDGTGVEMEAENATITMDVDGAGDDP